VFRDQGCFLHIISLLNGTFNEVTAERLVLNVLETLTLLLKGNDTSKVIKNHVGACGSSNSF
jgi:hypothetical protein